MKLLIFGHSSLGTHRVSIGFLTRFHKGTIRFVDRGMPWAGKPFCANASTSLTSVTPGRALPMARRLIASFQHSGLGCSQAPLPGIRRLTSTSASVSPELLVHLTSRTSCNRAPASLHPIHVRTALSASAASLCAATAFFANFAAPSGILDVRTVLGPVLLILTRAQPQT